MAASLGPVLTTLFAPAAKGAIAGAWYGGIGAKAIGGAIAGLGMAKLEEAQMREEERQQIAEEERKQATYEGSADAMRFWDTPEDRNNAKTGNPYQRADAQSNSGLAVGQRERRGMLGEKFRTPDKPRLPRYEVDENGRIVTQ